MKRVKVQTSLIFVLSFVVLSVSGCQLVDQTKLPSATTSETTLMSESSIVETQNEISESLMSTPTTGIKINPTVTASPTTEATPTPKTPETTIAPTTKPTPIATIKPSPTNKPTPTEVPDELEGVTAERLEFTKDMLEIYDNCADSSVFGKFREYVSREQIINYGKTGEGLSVVKYDNGTPAIALVNCNSTVTSAFKSMVNEMEQYDSNYLKKLTNNGFVAFMINRYTTSISSDFKFNSQGLINWNLDPNKVVSAANLRRPIETECFGIKMLNLGGDYSRYIGFMKEQLSSDCWWNLYKKTGNDLCYDMSHASYMVTQILYNPAYSPVTFKDEKIQNLLKNIRDKNLTSSFGGSWSEITTNIADRPDWTE